MTGCQPSLPVPFTLGGLAAIGNLLSGLPALSGEFIDLSGGINIDGFLGPVALITECPKNNPPPPPAVLIDACVTKCLAAEILLGLPSLQSFNLCLAKCNPTPIPHVNPGPPMDPPVPDRIPTPTQAIAAACSRCGG
jgi:hypothetical protein